IGGLTQTSTVAGADATVTPASSGTSTLYYWATDNAGNAEPLRSLTLAPAPVLSRSRLDFVAAAGTVSAVQSVTLTNSGTATLPLRGITTTDAAFTLTPADPCGAALPPGASCSIRVVFNPFTAQHYDANVEIGTELGHAPIGFALAGEARPAE